MLHDLVDSAFEVAAKQRIEGVVRELYDVVTLPGCRRPMAIGSQSDEIRRVISVGEAVG